ncbi:hypothetical protein HZS_6925 [Henneguya salminicola]|nr:hypothetical protein HZS_6925 [Henneguya salminicola]
MTSMTVSENGVMRFYFIKNSKNIINNKNLDNHLIDYLFLYNQFTFINLACNPCKCMHGRISLFGRIKTYFMNYDNIYRAMIINLKINDIGNNLLPDTCKKNKTSIATVGTKNTENLNIFDKDKCSFRFGIKAKDKLTMLDSLILGPNTENLDTKLYLQIDRINDTFRQEINAQLKVVIQQNNPQQIFIIKSFDILLNLYSYEYTTEKFFVGFNNKFNISYKIYYMSYGYSDINARKSFDSIYIVNSSNINELPKCRAQTLYHTLCAKNFACKPNTCKNKAKCAGTIYNYECDCINGTYGKNCEFYSCDPPCVNSECIGINKCSRKCNPGWSGKNCTDVSCKGYPCLNGAACAVENNIRVCKCNKNKYTGEFCQLKCRNKCFNGICDFKHEAIKCVCHRGFYGKWCKETYHVVAKHYKTSTAFFVWLFLLLFILFVIFPIALFCYIFVAKKNIGKFYYDNGR